MRDIHLLVESLQSISDNRIVDAISFAIRADAVGNHLVVALCALVVLYGLYKVVKGLISH